MKIIIIISILALIISLLVHKKCTADHIEKFTDDDMLSKSKKTLSQKTQLLENFDNELHEIESKTKDVLLSLQKINNELKNERKNINKYSNVIHEDEDDDDEDDEDEVIEEELPIKMKSIEGFVDGITKDCERI